MGWLEGMVRRKGDEEGNRKGMGKEKGKEVGFEAVVVVAGTSHHFR